MATASSNGGEQTAGGSSVRYQAGKGADLEAVQVEVESPAKNRLKGTTMGLRRSSKRLKMFERASGSWWNPKFDSEVLESQVWKSYFPQTRRRFQYVLIYICLACAAWLVFFGVTQAAHWVSYLGGIVAVLVGTVLVLGFTKTRFYERLYIGVSVLYIIMVGGPLLSSFVHHPSDLSAVGSFTAIAEIILLVYTFIPMPLFVAVPVALGFSILYEVLLALRHPYMSSTTMVIGKVLLHLSIHVFGIHTFIMSQVRRRSTFWKIGQSVMARRDLLIEKQVKEKMIHSLMPPSVAQQVMKSQKNTEDEDDGGPKKRGSKKGRIAFRAFNMNKMENVSILFADIVGFTKMSSNKTAEHLVGLLNDLFGRFDKLCQESGCEKISTLGDCYYCVAGCPMARPDHAKCCVEMGLKMCTAIKQFDEDNQEQVDMRVGVHTGTVMCGIVGTRRFKFDVWSNDVILANNMESTGKPGQVHISEATYEFLKDEYEVEEGEEVEDNRVHKVLIEHYDASESKYKVRHKEDKKVLKTYFITGRKAKPEQEASPEVEKKTEAADAEGVDGSKDVEAGIVGEIAQATNHLESNEINGVTPNVLISRRYSGAFYGPPNAGSDDSGKPLTNLALTSMLCTNCGMGLCRRSSSDEAQEVVGIYRYHGAMGSASITTTEAAAASETTTQPTTTTTTTTATVDLDGGDPSMVPINSAWTALRNVQKQTDNNLIKFMNEDITDKEFFYMPPINKLTLSFTNARMENNYCNHFSDSNLFKEETMASPRYHSLVETIISFLYFLFIAISCFVVFEFAIPFMVVFVVALVIHALALAQAVVDVKVGKSEEEGRLKGLMSTMSGWYFRNFVGVVVASLPTIAVYSNLVCTMVSMPTYLDRFLCCAAVTAYFNFCNFTMLSSWMKTITATIAGICLLILLNVSFCSFDPLYIDMFNQTAAGSNNTSNQSIPVQLFTGNNYHRFEIIVSILIQLSVILFLNREFDISCRLSFHGSVQAEADKIQMEDNKDQCTWLLHNIIPEHVSEQLKNTSKYSKNHKDVGVIFATIINFNEFYDESYEGGREYLRVLNELVSDYEDLLDRKDFKDVEKIKTISSTFMAASGLNETFRNQNSNPKAHLYALMDFSLEMLDVVQSFNESILNFSFELNIGFNFGEVTAGVIGTTKLLYDIWGDTVNIASRMYSTGMTNKIQVPEATATALEDMFEFEYRGEISVKGKGQMKTYLVVGKKRGASWE